MKEYFKAADILLPDFSSCDGGKWAVIACDQHTGEPEYWESAKKIADGVPSTLELILPEVYLGESERRIPEINRKMDEYLKSVLRERRGSMIYLERTLGSGVIRRGIVGCIDLEDYEYTKGATSLVRATEGTVLDRIPPRVAIRRGASVELPHVMVLIDDPEATVVEPFASRTDELEAAYDFELMLGGGSIKGYYVEGAEQEKINSALAALITPEAIRAKYGADYEPLLFAVGDGNHSLATAKALWQEVKASLSDKEAYHPARYALVEIVNLHDAALEFEPIYRVMMGVDPEDVLSSLREYASALCGGESAQKIEFMHADGEGVITVERPELQLTVGTLQDFIDKYLAAHPGSEVDYIHGEDVTRALGKKADSIGFIFDGMSKDQLFKTVICDGALPRKTFSMGHAGDKRYYLECRKIK